MQKNWRFKIRAFQSSIQLNYFDLKFGVFNKKLICYSIVWMSGKFWFWIKLLNQNSNSQIYKKFDFKIQLLIAEKILKLNLRIYCVLLMKSFRIQLKLLIIERKFRNLNEEFNNKKLNLFWTLDFEYEKIKKILIWKLRIFSNEIQTFECRK